MKVLVFAFVLTFISVINCYKVSKIQGVKGDCSTVLFDSKFNSYVRCGDTGTTERLYKLDPNNKVVFVKEFKDLACRIFLNDKDDLYLICTQYIADGADIRIIRANSSEIENITSLKGLPTILNDNKGNLMYSGNGQGLFFIKYNTTESIAVKNLENFDAFLGFVTTDYNGDTFIQGSRLDDRKHEFVVIPAASKEGTPEGFVIQGLLNDTVDDVIQLVKLTSKNELLISIIGSYRPGSLKKMVNGTITTIYSNEVYQDYQIYPGKTRTLIIAYDFLNNNSRITGLRGEDEIFEVKKQRNEPWKDESKVVALDEEGNAFIGWYDELKEKAHLEFLNYTDTTTVEIDLADNPFIYGLVFDGNNNLWMNSDLGVYVIEKGSLKLQKVPKSTNFVDMWANTKRKESRVYLNSETALYVTSN